MEGGNRVRFGVRSVQVVGVDELEKGLVVEELGKRVLWVWVGQLITGGLACAGMMEAGESAYRVGYGSPGLLNDDLERKEKITVRSTVFSVRGMDSREINGGQGHGATTHEDLAENEATGRRSKNGGGRNGLTE